MWAVRGTPLRSTFPATAAHHASEAHSQLRTALVISRWESFHLGAQVLDTSEAIESGGRLAPSEEEQDWQSALLEGEWQQGSFLPLRSQHRALALDYSHSKNVLRKLEEACQYARRIALHLEHDFALAFPTRQWVGQEGGTGECPVNLGRWGLLRPPAVADTPEAWFWDYDTETWVDKFGPDFIGDPSDLLWFESPPFGRGSGSSSSSSGLHLLATPVPALPPLQGEEGGTGNLTTVRRHPLREQG